MTMNDRKHLILDANVLIDLQPFSKTLFPLISRYIGQLAIASTTLEEVQDFKKEDCEMLVILVSYPSIEQLMRANKGNTPLSFYDWVYLYLAQEKGWICVTNDKALREQCKERNLKVLWSIEMLCLMVEEKGLSKDRCELIICSMQENNPLFITESIVKQALERLDGLSG